VSVKRLKVTRAEILAFRRRVGALDQRLPRGQSSLRRAAWAGLQDSMPRAALLSLNVRVEGVVATTWEDPSLVQVWGPRYNVYVVAARDLPVFTLGRLPDGGKTREKAEDLAARLRAFLGTARMRYDEAGRALGVHGNALRYAALTGTLAIRWEGARLPTVWIVAPPEIDGAQATLELARRYLHILGPATPEGFAKWAGIGARKAVGAFDDLGGVLIPVQTPSGDGWILAGDEPTIREPPGPAAPARLLPSGDAYTLGMTSADRALLVPDAERRRELWTPRVWPGALLVAGDVVGTWRRAEGAVRIQTWQRLSGAARDAVVKEAESMPLPGASGQIVVHWD
jgi:Winged helix DNA-binding domain